MSSINKTNSGDITRSNSDDSAAVKNNSSNSTTGRSLAETIRDAARILPFIPNKAHQYTYKELQAIEKRRRNILPRVALGFWELLARWDGTCLRFLITDVLLWSTVLTYIAVRVVIRYSSTVPDFVDTLANGDITIVGGFLTFFLVLYVNKSHARYFELYGHSMACKGRIFDVAGLAIAYLPKDTATKLVRYMNAAHISGYVGLNETYPAKTFFAQMNQDCGLLTENEMERMNEMDLDQGGSCNRELIVWCLRLIQECQKSDRDIDNELARQFREQILQLRASIGKIYNAADLPVPFFYVHFICLLTVMYLPLFAVSTAFQAGTGDEVFWTADLVGGLVVFFQSMFVIGLRILGQYMNDPYGDDLIDLSVMFYCTFTWRMSNRMLEANFADKDASEAKLKKERTNSIGAAWKKSETADVWAV